MATYHTDPYHQFSRIDEANGHFLSSLYPYFHSPRTQTATAPAPRPAVLRPVPLSSAAFQPPAESSKGRRVPAHVYETRRAPSLAEVAAVIPHEDFEINSEVRERRVAQWQAEAERADYQLAASLSEDSFPLHGATAGNAYTVGHLVRAMEAYNASRQKLFQYDTLFNDDSHAPAASPSLPEEDDPTEDPEVQSWVTAWRVKREEAQKVSFKMRLQETESRFKDQLAVHREMNQAFSRVAQIQKETQVMKAERRTTALVGALLQKQNEQLLKVFPSESPFWKQMEADEARMTRIAQVQQPYVLRPDAGPPTEAKTAVTASSTSPTTRLPAGSPATFTTTSAASPTAASPTTANPMLLEILNQFSKPKNQVSSDTASDDKGRSKGGGGKRGNKAEPPKKTLASLSVKALEPAPTPYVRIRYVLRKEEEPGEPEEQNKTAAWSSPGEKEYADDFEDEIEDDAISDVASSQPFDEDYANDDSILSEEGAEGDDAAHHRKSYVSGVIEDEDDDVSAAADSSENGSDSYGGDIEDESDESDSSDGDGSTGKKRRKRRKSKLTTDEVVHLHDMLKEFYAACRNTNALGKALLERKGSGAVPPASSRKTSMKKKKTEISSSSAGITDKEEEKNIKVQIEKEFADIRRLRRFNKRIKENMKAVDLQRKAHEAKKRLLDKAVRLSKAVKKQRKNRKAFIRDIIEDEDEQLEIGSVLDSLDSRKKGRKKGKGSRRTAGGGGSGSGLDDIEDEVISDYDLGDFDEESDGIIDDESAIAEDDSAYGSDDFIEDDDDEYDDGIVYDESEMDNDADGSIEDEIDDMVEDGAYSDNFSDGIESDAVLDEEEEGLIQRLASVSDVEDIVSSVGLEDLATGSEQGGSVADDEVASDEGKDASFHSSNAGAVEDDDNASEVGNAQVAATPSSPSSSSLSSHSSDADVSSPYPSSHPSADYELNSSERSELEAEDGEAALQEMEQDLRLTASRRQSALEKVSDDAFASLKPFTTLYDPTVQTNTNHIEDDDDDEDDKPGDERSRLKSMLTMPPSRRASSALAPVPPSPPSLPALFASEEYLPALRVVEVCAPTTLTQPTVPDTQTPTAGASPSLSAVSRKEKRLVSHHQQESTVHYLADDLVALNEWKRRQKDLIRQLFTPSVEEEAATPEEKGRTEKEATDFPVPSGPSETDYHWGQLEALLETRFGATPPRMDTQQYDRVRQRRFLEFSSSSGDESGITPPTDTKGGKTYAQVKKGEPSEAITGSERT